MSAILESKGFEIAVLEPEHVRYDVVDENPDDLPGVLEGTVSISATRVKNERWSLVRITDSERNYLFEVTGNRRTAVDAISNWVKNEWA